MASGQLASRRRWTHRAALVCSVLRNKLLPARRQASARHARDNCSFVPRAPRRRAASGERRAPAGRTDGRPNTTRSQPSESRARRTTHTEVELSRCLAGRLAGETLGRLNWLSAASRSWLARSGACSRSSARAGAAAAAAWTKSVNGNKLAPVDGGRLFAFVSARQPAYNSSQQRRQRRQLSRVI